MLFSKKVSSENAFSKPSNKRMELVKTPNVPQMITRDIKRTTLENMNKNSNYSYEIKTNKVPLNVFQLKKDIQIDLHSKLEKEPLVLDPLVLDPLVLDPLVLEPLQTDPLVLEPLQTDPLVLDPLFTTKKETIVTSTTDVIIDSVLAASYPFKNKPMDISMVEIIVEKYFCQKMEEYLLLNEETEEIHQTKLEEVIEPVVARIVQRIIQYDYLHESPEFHIGNENDENMVVHYDDVYESKSILSELSDHPISKFKSQIYKNELIENVEIQYEDVYGLENETFTENISKYKSQKWNLISEIHLEEEGTIMDICEHHGKVYLVGNFSSGQEIKNIACWDPVLSQFSPLKGTLNNMGSCLTINKEDELLFVGGTFTNVGDESSNDLSVMNISMFSIPNQSWYPLKDAYLNSECHCLTWDKKRRILYVGGSFTKIGELEIQYLAEYHLDTMLWKPFSGGEINGSCRCMCLDEERDCLYVGGLFTKVANTILLSHIGSYDLQTQIWNTFMGGELQGYVNVLLLEKECLYVGGTFSNIKREFDFVNAYHIACYDLKEREWKDMQNGVNGIVFSLAVVDNILYMGGSFTKLTFGDVSVNHFASYNTIEKEWCSDHGSAINSSCRSLCVFKKTILCGGNYFVQYHT